MLNAYERLWFNDNYDKFSSHVIPGMIMKFIDAIKLNKKKLNYLAQENH